MDASAGPTLKGEYMLLQKRLKHLEAKESRLKQLCEEWNLKPKAEKQFDPFYRAVHALAHSTGVKLKTRVEAVSDSDDDVQVSFHTFSNSYLLLISV